MLRSFLKGLAGEWLNRLGHRWFLPEASYTAFHNIIIPGSHGTSEIDHLLVSKFGVFVVETKFWSGWLFGGEADRSWTRVHYRSRIQVQNPVRQNRVHVRAVAGLLGIPESEIRSVVAIRGASLKTEKPAGVVFGGYARYVARFRDAVLSDAEIAAILKVLRSDRVGRGFFARFGHALRTRMRRGRQFAGEA